MRLRPTAPPRTDRPVHAQSTEAAAQELHESIKTFRTDKNNAWTSHPGVQEELSMPSFTRGYGWRITPERLLALSLGAVIGP